jgi:phosphate-selective porin
MTRIHLTLTISLFFATSALAQTGQPTPSTDPPPIRVGPVTITGYIQADALTVADDDLEESTDTFRIRRMRFGLSGDLAPKIGWAFSVEVAGSPHLRDAYITLRFAEPATVRIGQFYQPFSLDRLTSTSRSELIERAPITDRIALTRDPGIMVYNVRPFFGWLSYWVDVSNGTGMNVSDNNDAKEVTGRIVIAPPPVQGLNFGVNASSGEEPPGTRTRTGVDVSYDRRHFKVVAEALREESDGTGPDRDGFYIIGVYRFLPAQATPHFRQADVVARYAVASDPSTARDATPTRSAIPDTTREFQLGANYYVNRNVRFQGQAVFPVDDRESPAATVIGRMQVLF